MFTFVVRISERSAKNPINFADIVSITGKSRGGRTKKCFDGKNIFPASD
jgi:hypothetical protein